MHCNQTYDRMPMSGQDNILTCLSPADEISQTCFGIGYRKLHVVPLTTVKVDHLAVQIKWSATRPSSPHEGPCQISL